MRYWYVFVEQKHQLIGKRWYYANPAIYEAAREINNEISNTIVEYTNNHVLESIEQEKIDGEMIDSI